MRPNPTQALPAGPRPAPDIEWPIELLRLLAALLVVAAHYLPAVSPDIGVFRFAYTGVDLFFVITGYVFARHLFHGVGNLKAYALRRFFRIYPLYVAALLVYAAVRLYNGGQLEYIGLHLLFLYTLESRDIAFFYNPAFWSLPPEVEFYIALPLLALAVRRTQAVWWLLALAAAMHLLVVFFITPGAASISPAFLMSVHLPGLLIEFLIGALAWATARQLTQRWQAALLLGVGITGWLVLASYLPGPPAALPAWLAWAKNYPGLLAAACFACVVTASVHLLGSVQGWPARWAIWAGNLTYGIYLFHNAPLQLLEPLRPTLGSVGLIATCLAATLAVAFVLHHAVEKPAKALGRKLARQAAGQPGTSS